MSFLIDWIFSGSYIRAQEIKLMKKIGNKVDEIPMEDLKRLIDKYSDNLTEDKINKIKEILKNDNKKRK